MRVRKGIDYFEFQGGYALCSQADLLRLMAGYRAGLIRRRELRVFAARLEMQAVHKKSKVDLKRVLNARSSARGVRRLTRRAACDAAQCLDSLVSGEMRLACGPSRMVPIARRALRYVASGRATTSEALVLLYFMLRRMRPKRTFSALRPKERYARFRYSELRDACGLTRANACKAVQRLKARGWLNTARVPKRNENAYGQLFVDGALVSLAGASRPVENPSRAARLGAQNDNAPRDETITLKNKYPKTGIKGRIHADMGTGLSRRAEFERIKRRAEQMKAEFLCVAA